MNITYEAYRGEFFTIEWYFDNKGKSPALTHYLSLPLNEKIATLHLFKRMGDGGKIMDKTKFNHEGDKLFAFKPQPNRFLCFFTVGKKIIITHGFVKKSQKLPALEKKRALKIKQEYEHRIATGDYYEKV
ncbi:MAG TPA: type II toxin-antitoxin system RelE/ParE family toxin [Gammaproteobacteria bacterium]|nr:type II toxin-antitoxin system RelE/ParE family toxin [Gammaproteobacteria bacterium]